MVTVSRAEFDDLRERVDRLENSQRAMQRAVEDSHRAMQRAVEGLHESMQRAIAESFDRLRSEMRVAFEDMERRIMDRLNRGFSENGRDQER